MELIWNIEERDVAIVNDFFSKWSKDPFVKLRQKRNIDGPRQKISKGSIWTVLVGCLLTSQQRSGPGSPVKRILDSEPFPLRYDECIKKDDLAKFAHDTLEQFGGIRRPPTISKQISSNFQVIESRFWNELLDGIELINKSDDPIMERKVAYLVAKKFKGIGPKQSRNFLQWIGVSKYEIPIDSRITKWLNRNLLKYHLTANLLANPIYYDMVSDGVQLLCKKSGIYPCLLDAAIFTSFDGGWSETDIGPLETAF